MPLGLVVKERSLNVSRQNCWLVLTRNYHPRAGNDRFGKWEPVSAFGFKLVCPSKKEATEAVLIIGGRLYPWPGMELTDDQYERWLLSEHFKMVPYVAEGKGEVMFSDWIRGWMPDADELQRGCANSVYLELFQNEVRRRLGD